MKKLITVFLLVLISITVVGCTKKEEKGKKSDKQITGGWEVFTENNTQMIEEELEKAFDDAAKTYAKGKLERVVLLAEQVVSGKNYMFLAKGDKGYKIVVLYRDLKGNSSITNVTDFDVTKYVSKNIESTAETLAGGWEVIISGKPIMLDKNVQVVFDNAIDNNEGTKYYPAATIAKQVVAGTNYAVLSYGRDEEGKEGLYLLTIYNDLDNNAELTSSAYIDLSEYNK